jgi:predicted small integral membrane protein
VVTARPGGAVQDGLTQILSERGTSFFIALVNNDLSKLGFMVHILIE